MNSHLLNINRVVAIDIKFWKPDAFNVGIGHFTSNVFDQFVDIPVILGRKEKLGRYFTYKSIVECGFEKQPRQLDEVGIPFLLG